MQFLYKKDLFVYTFDPTDYQAVGFLLRPKKRTFYARFPFIRISRAIVITPFYVNNVLANTCYA